MLIDPHCHLDDPSLLDSLDVALEQALSAGVRGALIPGYGPARWPRQSELLRRDGDFILWGGFGLHPWAIDGELPAQVQLARLEQGWREHAVTWGDRLRAVGEFGLDRSRRMQAVPLQLQRELFSWHLDKARQRDLPLILHLVRCDGLALSLLAESGPWTGVVHAFSSHRQTVPAYLETGLALSYGGGLLRSEKVRQALKATPLERLMFETDAPAGAAGLGGPAQLLEIVQAASQVLGKSVEYLLARQRENCQRIFRFNPA